MENINTKAEQFKRDELKKLYEQCTDKQQKFFNRLWKSIEDIQEKDIHIAFDLCQRTLIKNKQSENKWKE